jgi:SHS2 domain-containing protein
VTSGHRQVEHTADIALELWAASEPELLIEGARALVEIMTEGALVGAPAEKTVEIDAVDSEDRLVCWLNEVLYLAVTEGFLFAEGDLVLTGTGLSGKLRGDAEAHDRIRTELKSVTYHDLELEHGQDGVRARLVIDV